MRRLARIAPIGFVVFVALMAGLRTLIEGIPFELRIDRAILVGLAALPQLFVFVTTERREPTELRAARNEMLGAIGLIVAIAAGIAGGISTRNDRWTSFAFFTVTALFMGLAILAIAALHRRGSVEAG